MKHALAARVPGGEAVVGNLYWGRTRPEPLHRMVLRERLPRVLDDLLKTRQTLLERVDAEAETVMPGYTHLSKMEKHNAFTLTRNILLSDGTTTYFQCVPADPAGFSVRLEPGLEHSRTGPRHQR